MGCRGPECTQDPALFLRHHQNTFIVVNRRPLKVQIKVVCVHIKRFILTRLRFSIFFCRGAEMNLHIEKWNPSSSNHVWTIPVEIFERVADETTVSSAVVQRSSRNSFDSIHLIEIFSQNLRRHNHCGNSCLCLVV